MKRICFTVGANAKGELSCLYVGESSAESLKPLEKPPEGIHEIFVFRKPIHSKHRETEEKTVLDRARADAFAKEHAENLSRAVKAAAEKAAAEKEAKAAAKASADAEAKAKTAEGAKATAAKEAAILERAAVEKRKAAGSVKK